MKPLAGWKLIAVLMLAALPATAADRSGSISGVVKDSKGIPQMGATVQVMAASAESIFVYTDAHGYYLARNLAPGRYLLRVTQSSFLPTLRENLSLHAGAGLVVNFTLNTLFEALQALPVHGRSADDQDDWKWTLRSTASRPILRVLDDGPQVVISDGGSGEERTLKARVEFLAGSQEEGIGSSAGQATSLSVERSLFTAGKVSFTGSMGSNFGEPAALRASYSHQFANGDHPEMTVTIRHFATEAGDSGQSSAQALAFSLKNQTRLTDFADLQYGSEYQTIEFLGHSSALRPFATLDVHLSPRTYLEYGYTTLEPNLRLQKGFDTAPADLTESGPRVSMYGFTPQIQDAQHQEVSLSHRLGHNSFQLAGFSDRLEHAALLGIGNNGADVATGAVLADPYSSTFTYDGGAMSTKGVRAVAQRNFNSNLTGTLDVAYGGALTLRSPGSFVIGSMPANEAFTEVRQTAIAAKLAGRIPASKTSWIASYRWTPGSTALTPVDAFNVSAGQTDPFLNLFIRQPLPSVSFLPGKMEAVVDIRNLLSQGYIPVIGQDGHTLYLVQSARSIRGGVAFSF